MSFKDATVSEKNGLEDIQAFWQDRVNASGLPDKEDASGDVSLQISVNLNMLSEMD